MTDETELLQQATEILPGVTGQSDEDLIQSIWPALNGEFVTSEMAGASAWDRILEWSKTELQSRAAGRRTR